MIPLAKDVTAIVTLDFAPLQGQGAKAGQIGTLLEISDSKALVEFEDVRRDGSASFWHWRVPNIPINCLYFIQLADEEAI